MENDLNNQINVRIVHKNDTYENWTKNNPVLLNSEIGYDSTNKKIKIGDGITEWNLLPYYAGDVKIQSDFEQKDSTQPDFIKNKPETLNNLLSSNISEDNVLVVENANGEVLKTNYMKTLKRVYTEDSSYEFNFKNMDLTELIMIAEGVENISFTFEYEVSSENYSSSIYFKSGETPTAIDYIGNGVLNWIGTDCVTDSYVDDEGNTHLISKFQPSSNTHYDILFYFSGIQLIGLVLGYVPASANASLSGNEG